MTNPSHLLVIISFSFLASCMQVEVFDLDFTQQQGLYVVAYTDDVNIRSQMEDQLVADLIEQNMIAMVSYPDVADIISSTHDELISAASEKNVLGIIVINRVASDGTGGVIQNPDRISPVHPTIIEFYAYSREQAGESYKEDSEVFAEVNLFALDNGTTKLFWSGTTWSFSENNQGGAIADISNIITEQLVELRSQFF